MNRPPGDGYKWIALSNVTLAVLAAHNRALLAGRSFFPQLISAPFRTGLHETFAFSIGACVVAAAASLMRGGHRRAEKPARGGEEADANGSTATGQIDSAALPGPVLR